MTSKLQATESKRRGRSRGFKPFWRRKRGITMAGKRTSPFSSPLLKPPPLTTPKVEDETECWRKEVDENLKRLQSLLFGADQFLEKSDFSSAQILGLRLLGFLDSRSVTEADRAFIGPIRREVASKVDSALEGLVSDSDR